MIPDNVLMSNMCLKSYIANLDAQEQRRSLIRRYQYWDHI